MKKKKKKGVAGNDIALNYIYEMPKTKNLLVPSFFPNPLFSCIPPSVPIFLS